MFNHQCRRYFRVARCSPNDPESIAFAALSVRGETPAHVWAEYEKALPPHHRVTWEEFLKVLRNDLGCEKTFIDKTWSTYFGLSQRPTESVRAYSVQLQQTCSVLQEYDRNYPRESEMIRRVRDGLRPEIRAALYTLPEQTDSYNSFVNSAMQAEASVQMNAAAKAAKHREKSKRKRSRSGDPSPTRSPKGGRNRKRGKGRDKPSADNTTGSANTPATGANAEATKVVTCYNCGEEGHISPKCPHPPKAKN